MREQKLKNHPKQITVKKTLPVQTHPPLRARAVTDLSTKSLSKK
jgi:hypothetical protein